MNNYWRIIWILAIIGIIANLFDCVTTYIALQKENIEETTIFMKFLFDNYGVFGYVVKLALGTWILLPLKFCPLYYFLNSRLKIVKWMGIIIVFIIIFIFMKVGVGNIIEIGISESGAND